MNIQKFDYSTDVLAVNLWQYDNATNLLGLMKFKQAWLDQNQTLFWEKWYDNVFNLASPTITLFGLSVWSIILNVPLFAPIGSVPSNEIWGFNEFDPTFPDYVNDNVNYDNGVFGDAQVTYLSLPQQQFLLMLRYFDCITRGSMQDFIPINFKTDLPTSFLYQDNFRISINTYLQYLCFNFAERIGYGTNTIVCLDNLDMTVTYHFSDINAFPVALYNAILALDLWPRPAGVSVLLT